MKKLYCVLLALTVLITPYAQAKTCYGTYCVFTDTNPGFENTPPGQYWSTGGATFPVETACYNSHVAELENTDAIWRFPFVDGTFSSGFKLEFRAYLPDDTDNFYDELKITVRNRDTNVSETMYLHGNSYNSHCGVNTFYLSNNYSNANVLIEFESGGLSSHKWQIDDVLFIGYY